MGEDCEMDPNLKTLKLASNKDVLDYDDDRIEKNLRNFYNKNKINKLEEFNKFVTHQLTTVDNHNKQIAESVSHSLSPPKPV